MSRAKLAPGRAEFYQGLAAGLAFVARDVDHPSMAADAMVSLGVSLTDFQSAKVDEFDLMPLVKAWLALPEKRRLSRAGRKGES